MGILTNLSLFSGAGGLDLGAKLIGGFRTVAYCEWDEYAKRVLISRMRDGGLDRAPLWDDVSTFDGHPWRGLVDVVSGGFPCQPHSASGQRRGALDERNLWPEYLRIVQECRPSFVLGENVAGIFSTGFATEVMADLEEIGYCVTPTSVLACEVGGPYPRSRVFFIAHAASLRFKSMVNVQEVESALLNRKMYRERIAGSLYLFSDVARDVGESGGGPIRNDDGLETGLDRLRLCGNGVFPGQSAPAWEKIKEIAQCAGMI